MKDYVQPYIKENNVIQLGLFYFGDKRIKKRMVTWSDCNGDYSLKISCEYGIPGSLEQDIYTVIMKMWLLQGMKSAKIILNYSEIARELELPPNSWVTRIKKSLQRLATTQYEFTECFVKANSDGNNKITTYFSLFDSVSLYESSKSKSRRNSKSQLTFPNDIVENVQSNYYQFLDMHWYKSLPDGLSRRLYEFLAKKYYLRKGDIFRISEEAICRWLPITDKNSTKRKRRIEKIALPLIEAGFLKDYKFDKSNKLCSFEYSKDIRAKVKFDTPDYEEIFDDPITLENTAVQIKFNESEPENKEINKELDVLFSEAKSLTESLKEKIKEYHNEKGFDYVLWNIRYANSNAKKSYSTYLCKTLKENWAVGWKDEQLQKVTQQSLPSEEEESKHKLEMHKKMLLDNERTLFKKEHNKLLLKEKSTVWEKAEKTISEDIIGRGMLVKIEYVRLIREILSKNGLEFSEESLSSLDFIKKVANKPR